MSWSFTHKTQEHLGYWRAYNTPSPQDLEAIFRDSSYQQDYRILIHGAPWHPSPDWQERHPGEASKDEATYPYNVGLDSMNEAIIIVIQYMLEFSDDAAILDYANTHPEIFETIVNVEEYEENLQPDATFITNFANVLIGATSEDCWADAFWIDFVDL